MVRSNSEKILIAGAIAGGAYVILKTLNPEIGEGSGEGSIGGSDDQFEDDLLEQQGFDIDPNSAPSYDPYQVIDETTNIPIDTPIIPTDPNSSNDPRNSSPLTSTSPTIANANIPPVGLSAGTDLDIPTVPQFGLGVLGLTGSYFSAFGKSLLKTSDELGFSTADSLLKRTAKEGVSDIPFFGKQAEKFVFDQGDTILKVGGSQVAESALKIGGEQVAESAFKAGAKRVGKAGIGLIPFVGTVAGAEFDVAVSDRPRVLAYGANIFGDILGALAVAGGALIGVSETGVGAVALGVGGQIAGEQIVYTPYDLLTGNFKFKAPTPEEQEEIDYNREVALGGTMVPEWVQTPNLNVDYSNNSIQNKRSTSGSSGGSGNSSIFSSVSSASKATVPTVTNSNGSRSSSRSSSSSGINTSRFVKQSGGGYSDTVAKQSVSSSVALSRSKSNNYFGSSSSSSRSSGSSSSSSKSSGSSKKSSSSSPFSFSSYSAPKTSSRYSSNSTNTSSSSRVSSSAKSSSSRSAPKTTPKSSFVSRSVSSAKSTVSKVRSWFRRK